MKTKYKVKIYPVWVDIIPKELEQNKIYISLRFMTSVHLCLCGCRNKSVTPLNKDGWFLTDVDDKITLTPSILNRNCPKKSHYIINKNIANII